MAYPNLPPAPPPPAPENVGSTNVAFNTSLRMDLSYLTTPIGIVRAIIVLLNIIGAICIACSAFSDNWRGVLFTVVAVSGLFFTLLFTYAYTSHLVEKYHNWRWLKIEVIAAVVFVFLNLMNSTIAVAFGPPSFSAAGFFGYLCMVCYGADAFLRMRALRSGRPAQGLVVTNKPTTNQRPTV